MMSCFSPVPILLPIIWCYAILTKVRILSVPAFIFANCIFTIISYPLASSLAIWLNIDFKNLYNFTLCKNDLPACMPSCMEIS